jgi:hypothetical protein
MAKWGGPILAISMFWFGWTSYPSISLWAPVVAGLGVGLSLIMLFLSLFNYIIDAYILVAASALASSTVVRSAFGAGFPVGNLSLDPLLSSPFTILQSRYPPLLYGCTRYPCIPIFRLNRGTRSFLLLPHVLCMPHIWPPTRLI